MTHLAVELARFAVEFSPEQRQIAVQFDEPVVAEAVLNVDDRPAVSVPAGGPVMGTAFTNVPPEAFTHRLRVTVTLHPTEDSGG